MDVTLNARLFVNNQLVFCSKLPESGKHVHEKYTPLNPTFIQKNWGLQGYIILFFLFFLQNIDCGYL